MKRDYLFLKDSCGSLTFLVAVLMFVIVGLLAFVIDLAHVKTVKTELSNAGDDCALRGARGFFPDNLTNPSQTSPNEIDAANKAEAAIRDNKSDNNYLTDLPSGDIQVGVWDYIARNWLYGGVWQWPPDETDWGKYIGPGVGLITRRSGSYNTGPVTTALARIFGINTVAVRANATAALSGVGGIPPDYIFPEFPLVLQEQWVLDNMGGPPVYAALSPDGQDKGGWTDLDADAGNDARSLLGDKNSPNEPVPELLPGQEISFKNGVDCDTVKAMIQQSGQEWDRFFLEQAVDSSGSPIKGVYRPSKDIYFLFPVVPTDKMVHSSIYGVVRAKITEVRDSNAVDDPETPEVDESQYNCRIQLQILTEPYVAPGTYGGGKYYGVLSVEPKLVQ